MAFNPMSARWCRLYRGTSAELALEPAIAELGVPYRNNFPGFLYGVRYFPDFFLPTLRLIIEVDDDSHNEKEKQEADEERTRTLEKEWDVTVVRCKNEEAMNDPRGTVHRLLKSIGMWPLPSSRPRLQAALPAPKKAPRKNRRQAKSAARRAARSKGRESSSRSRQTGSLSNRRTPSTPTPEPLQAQPQ